MELPNQVLSWDCNLRTRCFRSEAGLDQAWGGRDCGIILTVVTRFENILQEDPKLLMWYTQALVRTEGDVDVIYQRTASNR